jgi:hypothetical protein
MTFETIVLIVGGVVLGGFSLVVVAVRMPKRLKNDYFVAQWKELQALCRDKKSWPKALEDADKLLDRALKKRKFKGRRMGERLVSAQRILTDNDNVWFAHNLYKKVASDQKFKLKESDVKDALIGFRQALRDLGALPTETQDAKGKK